MDEVDAEGDLVTHVPSAILGPLQGHSVTLPEVKEDCLRVRGQPSCDSCLLMRYSLPGLSAQKGVLHRIRLRWVVSCRGDDEAHMVSSACSVRNDKVASGRIEHVLLESIDGYTVQEEPVFVGHRGEVTR